MKIVQFYSNESKSYFANLVKKPVEEIFEYTGAIINLNDDNQLEIELFQGFRDEEDEISLEDFEDYIKMADEVIFGKNVFLI